MKWVLQPSIWSLLPFYPVHRWCDPGLIYDEQRPETSPSHSPACQWCTPWQERKDMSVHKQTQEFSHFSTSDWFDYSDVSDFRRFRLLTKALNLHNGLQLGFSCVVVEDEERFLLLYFLRGEMRNNGRWKLTADCVWWFDRTAITLMRSMIMRNHAQRPRLEPKWNNRSCLKAPSCLKASHVKIINPIFLSDKQRILQLLSQSLD